MAGRVKMIPVLQIEDRDAIKAAEEHLRELGYKAKVGPFSKLPESKYEDWMVPENEGFVLYIEEDQLEPVMQLLAKFFKYEE